MISSSRERVLLGGEEAEAGVIIVRRRQLIGSGFAIAAALVLVVVAIVMLGGDDDGDTGAATGTAPGSTIEPPGSTTTATSASTASTSTTSTTPTTTSTSSTTTTGATTTSAPTTSVPTTGPPILDDGRHAVWFTEIDAGGSTVEFDVIQFLTGGEALAAYLENEPDPLPEGPPNDFYVLNENARLRRLPVDDAAAVTVLDPTADFAPRPVELDELAEHVAGYATPDVAPHLAQVPFWLTVRDDIVVAVEEQFIP